MASTPLLRFSLLPHYHSQSQSQTLTRKNQSYSGNLARLPHPLRSNSNIFVPTRSRTVQFQNPKPKITSASYNPTPATERLISAVSYFLPFFNGLQYGRFLLAQYPVLGVAFEPILPLLSLYRSVPYASFVAFFALYLGVVRNAALSRYVRFNAMQAVVLDVLLVLPLLLQRIFNPGRSGFGYKLLVMGHNFMFVFICFCFVYSLVSSVLGRTPYLPFVADAAGRQL